MRTGSGVVIAPDLTCVWEVAAPLAVVRLSGRLDLGTAVDVRTTLYKALTEQPAAIVVDLSGLTVEDDVTLTVFLAFARTAAGWPGCPVLLCGAAGTLAEALDRMGIHRALPVYPDRATALVQARRLPAPGQYEHSLPDSPSASSVARRAVADACHAWQLPGLVEDAELVVTELVSNAVRHAPGDIHLLIVLRERFLHLSVRDCNPDPPRRRLPDVDSGEGGRGLLLLDAVAAGWGSIPAHGGKRVWATLRRP